MATTKQDEIYITVEVNAETGEVNERPLTDEELAERVELHAQFESRQAEFGARESARASALAKLADLGLTAEEIAAL